MKQKLTFLFIFILFFINSSFIFSSEKVENLLIPKTDKIYSDFYIFAENGLINSVSPEYFKYTTITKYEAALYVAEAVKNLKNTSKTKETNYYEYAKKLRAYAVKFYKKLKEMKKNIKEIEEIIKSKDLEEYKNTINKLNDEIFDIESEFNKTTFRGIPPFKVMGVINVRWQDIESFGVSHVHHTSLGGSYLQLWTEGIVSDNVSFKLNLTFERPADEAEKNTLPEYWGTGQRFLDKYTINLKIYDWKISTGFFWEDITPFIAKQILSERPVLFDRDVYALEETSKGHYENAFLHSFQKRGDIWSKHGWMGIGIYNLHLFGKGKLKLMAGKAEKFDEQYDKLYLYEYAGRISYPFNIPDILDMEIAANFFNTSNEKSEIETMAPETASADFPLRPDGYIQSATIGGGDLKLKLFNLLNLQGEIAYSFYNGRIPKPYDSYPNYNPPSFTQNDKALYIKGKLDFLPVEVKYTYIGPDYVATAAAVIDTSKRETKTPDYTVEISNTTYAGDPTLLWNNMQRISLFSNIKIPNGYILFNYGTSSQIRATKNELYLEHFLFGNRLNGAIWWHLFYSNYGYPVTLRDKGFLAYNTNGQGYHTIITDTWLTNKELIISNYGDYETKKYYNSASVELRYALNKLLRVPNNLFFQIYGELTTLSNGADFLVTFDPEELLCQNIISSFIVYGLTRKINIMAFAGVERWTTNKCDIPVDYLDNSYGVGLDYDFAPRTSIFLRVKRFIHNDRVITENSFDGWHLFMEFKNFF